MTRYAVVDLSNLFQRARHSVNDDVEIQTGMTMLIVLRSLRRLFRDHACEHVVFCVDQGRSWRYAAYPAYKARRRIEQASLTPEDQANAATFYAAMEEFIAFMRDKTRCTVLAHDGLEADDFIGRWVQLHPDDQHIILSSDSDFIQLLSENVSLYDGMEQRFVTPGGIVNDKQQPVTFSLDTTKAKIKVGPTIEAARKAHDAEQKALQRQHDAAERQRSLDWDSGEKVKLKADPAHVRTRYQPRIYRWVDYEFAPEADWPAKALFLKIIRGDHGDGIFGAYPGVRMKGSAAKPGLAEAWEDRHERTYCWNNIMSAEWEKLITNQDGTPGTKRVTVRDEFQINEGLIDLTKQPEAIKDQLDIAIVEAVNRPLAPPCGIPFMKFSARHALKSITAEITDHTAYLNAAYLGPLRAP